MPTYLYRNTSEAGCKICRPGFERLQSLNDAALQQCPRCFAPVARVVSAAHITTPSPDISRQNLDQKGFTQYRRLDKGVYEKTAGTGPDLLEDSD